MPLRLRPLILITVMSLVLTIQAQSVSDPILVDEFETLGCCDFRGRLDVFLSELASHPTDVGFIVTAGPHDKQVAKVVREEMIRSHILSRGFDAGKLRYIRTTGAQLQTRLFRLNSRSVMPSLPGTDNTYRMAVYRPTRLLVGFPHGDGGLCPVTDDREIFGLFIAANPTSRVKVVLRGYMSRDAKKLERELFSYFVHDVSVDRHRIQFDRGTLLPGEDDFGPTIEYWLVP
jgi:hypothetical protein